ncbi:hypothetical protein D3C71_1442800 [compost metagenome]
MKNNSWEQIIKPLIQLTVMTSIFTLIFSLASSFFWNVGMRWLVPSLPYMNFKVSLSLSLAAVIIYFVLNYFIVRITDIYAKKILAVEAQKDLIKLASKLLK